MTSPAQPPPREALIAQIQGVEQQLQALVARAFCCHGNDTELYNGLKDAANALSACLLHLTAQQEWQDIASAPTDGTAVLGYRGRSTSGVGGAFTHVTRFNGYNWATIPGKYTWGPTHWMPLPPAPVSSLTEGPQS